MGPAHIFQLVIYQPFFNILIFFYWMLDLVTQGHADMGIAVILMTVLIRVLLLPMSMAGHRSEKDRREIAGVVAEIEAKHAHDPIKMKQAVRKIWKGNTGVVAGEVFSLFVQVTISLMLWRMFGTGLTGQDLHLIYPFMPDVNLPFNLLFLGQYDLSHSSWTFNFIQTFLIFLLETISLTTSPYPTTRAEVVRLQFTLPLVSFLIFMHLPAGKKLFVITTLIFSIFLTIYRAVRRGLDNHQHKLEAKEAAALALEAEGEPEPEKVLVETKT